MQTMAQGRFYDKATPRTDLAPLRAFTATASGMRTIGHIASAISAEQRPRKRYRTTAMPRSIVKPTQPMQTQRKRQLSKIAAARAAYVNAQFKSAI